VRPWWFSIAENHQARMPPGAKHVEITNKTIDINN
jgi:hypothetical protein